MGKIKILFTLIIISSQYLSYGQNLLDTAKRWSVLNADEDIRPFHMQPTYETTWYRIKNQTVINKKSYYQIQVSKDSLGQNWKDTTIYLREEKLAIFQLQTDSDKYENEFKVYDFSLQENDTFLYTKYNTKLVVKVDSIRDSLINSYVRKIFYVSNYYQEDTSFKIPEIWIEGIGSLDGLLRDNYYFYVGNYNWRTTLCVYKDNEIQYHDTAYSSCYYNVTLESIFTNNARYKKIAISPNPVGNYFTLNTKERKTKKIIIYDIFGKIVRQQKIDTENRIWVNNLKKGIYFINIQTNKNNYTGKFIKN